MTTVQPPSRMSFAISQFLINLKGDIRFQFHQQSNWRQYSLLGAMQRCILGVVSKCWLVYFMARKVLTYSVPLKILQKLLGNSCFVEFTSENVKYQTALSFSFLSENKIAYCIWNYYNLKVDGRITVLFFSRLMVFLTRLFPSPCFFFPFSLGAKLLKHSRC